MVFSLNLNQIKMSKLENHPQELENLEYICGIDEVGRGVLAGPVVTAAVILPKDFDNELIKDSKKLSEKKRKQAYDIIIESAIDYSVDFVGPDFVDDMNILEATMFGMHKSLSNLKTIPEHILVDGNYFNGYKDIDHTCVIKGDNTYYSIAAASILAKVTRDEYMKDLHKEYPKYNWKSNKGYGSKEHITKIQSEGITPHHRKSFLKKIL